MSDLSQEEGIKVIEEHAAIKQIKLEEALEKWDLIRAVHDPVNGSYIVMADRDPKISQGTAIREMGYSSPSPFTAWTREERVGELRDKLGIRKYYDMKRADGTVRGALRILKTPILAARWFVEPASDSVLDKNIAEFVEDNLFNRLNLPWSRIIEDALLMCEYGYLPMEKVYAEPYSVEDKVKDGKFRLKKLAPRHPMDIKEWIYDPNGGPAWLVMEGTEENGWEDIPIPISKLSVFVLEQEAGDMRGISVLRSAYKHYYYKDTLYKIDAIQKERHGIGVPIIKLPMGFTADDRNLADDLGRNLRTNERAHITVPMNWEVAFAKLEGQPVDCMTSIQHHDKKIMSNILAPFLDDPGAKPDSMDMFFKSTRYIATTIADTFNSHCIPQLVDSNFARGGYPKLRARRIGEWEDLRTWSFAFRNLVGSGAILPDDPTEEFLRNELDLPPMDLATQRTPMMPQLPLSQVSGGDNSKKIPGQAGPPRQAAPGAKPPKANSGTDRSGG